MFRPQRVFASACLLLSLAAPAWADIPPPDACDTAGASCDNAGSSGDGAGTCVTRTCTRTTPDMMTMEYECLRCVEGAAGSGNTASGDDSDDGCSYSGVAPGGSVGSFGAMVLMSGGLLWVLARRRAHAKAR